MITVSQSLADLAAEVEDDGIGLPRDLIRSEAIPLASVSCAELRISRAGVWRLPRDRMG